MNIYVEHSRACKRERHDLCLLTRHVTRFTGRKVKVAQPAKVQDPESEEIKFEMVEEDETLIVKTITCECECHGK